jgi:hypothetical protein
VTIPDEDADKIITVQDAIDYLKDQDITDKDIADKPAPPKVDLKTKVAKKPTDNKGE